MSNRKAFNFYLSYYDVFKEIESDKERLSFITALLERQFEGKHPKDLKGMAKFGYASQKQVIETQVKGWEDKTGLTLTPYPTEGGCVTLSNPPSQQEKEKEKGEVKEESNKEDFRNFINWFNNQMIELKGKKGNFKALDKVYKSYNARLKEGFEKNDFVKAVKNISQDDYHYKENFKYLTPEFICRQDKLDRWANNEGKKIEKRPEDLGKGKGGVSLYEES